MANKGKIVDHTKRNFVIKLIICVNFIFFLIMIPWALIEGAKDTAEMESFGYRVERMEDSYYDGAFSWIRMLLISYDSEYDDMDNPAFDVYREAVKAHEDFAAWRTWYRCLGTELDAEAVVQEAAYRGAVYANARDCRDARNQKLLDKLVEQMETERATDEEEEL